MLKAIIVDDEQSGREMLELLLKPYQQEIDIAAICEGAEPALKAIEEHQPDVVFLDIEMPSINAFEMLKRVKEISFDVIFITAHNHYAIHAIELSAFAYLLKPVDQKKFNAAIQKFLEKKKRPDAEQLQLLLQHVATDKPEKIAVPTSEGLLFIFIANIIRCEADKNYTLIILQDKKKILVSKTLKEFEILLEPHGFMRIHHSHLVNLKHVEKYVRGEGGYVIMSDGQSMDISRSKKEEFLKQVFKV